MRPFLKWVGGKRSILHELEERVPKVYSNYHELFVGGGALFFKLRPKRAYLSDINSRLIQTYRSVRDEVGAVIDMLRILEASHSKANYLKRREEFNVSKSSVAIASLFIYLNKTCFNGLYRENKKGEFNVPIGTIRDKEIYSQEHLNEVSKCLKSAVINHQHFSDSKINANDFYYLDPPYHQTYSHYVSGGFDENEQKCLFSFCKKIDIAGGYFMLSNSNTVFIRDLYKRFNIEVVESSRSVSCNVKQRGKVKEVIIRNYE